MKRRPYKTVYRRNGCGWKWLILSRWDDSEVRSGLAPGLEIARKQVIAAHAELAQTTDPHSKRQHYDK